jgi:hypothetical protein
MSDSTFGSGAFERALVYAACAHAGHYRKGTAIPYVSHLLAVAALVMEAGGGEDEAIAALLHDVVEDRGGAPRLVEVRERFGDRVADIVWGCSDTDAEPKPPWRIRKEQYIAHLEWADSSVILVSLADKVHNARAILLDFRNEGERLWGRFDKDSDQLWYYRALSNAFAAKSDSALVGELERTITDLENVVLASAFAALTSGAEAGHLVISAGAARGCSIRFVANAGALTCEVVRADDAGGGGFSRDVVARLLGLGFQVSDGADQNGRKVFARRSRADYADVIDVVRTLISEVFGVPRDEPLEIERSWRPRA